MNDVQTYEMPPTCIFYQQGCCQKGADCHFKHDEQKLSDSSEQTPHQRHHPQQERQNRVMDSQSQQYREINYRDWQKLFIVRILDGPSTNIHGVIVNLMDHDGFFEVALIELDGKVMLQTHRIPPASLRLAEIKHSALVKVVKSNVHGDNHVVGITGCVQYVDDKDLVLLWQDSYYGTHELAFTKKHCAVVYDLA